MLDFGVGIQPIDFGFVLFYFCSAPCSVEDAGIYQLGGWRTERGLRPPPTHYKWQTTAPLIRYTHTRNVSTYLPLHRPLHAASVQSKSRIKNISNTNRWNTATGSQTNLLWQALLEVLSSACIQIEVSRSLFWIYHRTWTMTRHYISGHLNRRSASNGSPFHTL